VMQKPQFPTLPVRRAPGRSPVRARHEQDIPVRPAPSTASRHARGSLRGCLQAAADAGSTGMLPCLHLLFSYSSPSVCHSLTRGSLRGCLQAAADAGSTGMLPCLHLLSSYFSPSVCHSLTRGYGRHARLVRGNTVYRLAGWRPGSGA
jgi:hypothetical protein